MDYKNTDDYLTWIVINNNILPNTDKSVFAYKYEKDINNHSKNLDCFIEETHLDLKKNDWFFFTAQELAKMGHLVVINSPDCDEAILLLPDNKNLTPEQIDCIMKTKQAISEIDSYSYNIETNDFIEENELVNNQKTFCLKK